MKTLPALIKSKQDKPAAWVCSCGCVILKKGALLAGGPGYKYDYHVHCPWCSRIVDQFVDPKEVRWAGEPSMIWQRTKPANAPDQVDTQTTRRIDVTDLTPTQRRQLFADRFSQNGFVGFSKTCENRQTIYSFHYLDCIWFKQKLII